MNGTVNPNNTKNNSSAKTIINPTPAQPPIASGTAQKVPSNASSVVNNSSTRQPNGDVHSPATIKGKKPGQPTMDPSEMHEMLQNRIAALEGEKVQGGEDDKRSAEEARKTLKGMTLQQLHTKYVELYQDFRRQEREYAKERQKNKKESDASKTALSNVQKLKTKTDAVVRDMQKQNKDLREETKRLKSSLHQMEVQLSVTKEDLQKRVERDKKKEKRHAEMPDIVIKVVCRYRAELFFKISRKTKLARLFTAWTERMDARSYVPMLPEAAQKSGDMLPKISAAAPVMQFLFTHMGRGLELDQTPEDAGMEDGDEILAVEMMDLTGPDVEEIPKQERVRIQKNWSLDPAEARHSIENIFDSVVRERLKDLLRQYELREKHIDAILRSKELELMISTAQSQELKKDLQRQTEAVKNYQQENDELEKQLQDTQSSHQELVYQFEMCTTEVLAAIKSDGLESQKSVERARQVLEALRNQISAHFDVPETESVSDGDQGAQAG